MGGGGGLVVFSNISRKINFMTKNRPELCNFCRKLAFWKIFRKYFLFCFMDFNLLMFYSNIVEHFRSFEQWELVENLSQVYLPY